MFPVVKIPIAKPIEIESIFDWLHLSFSFSNCFWLFFFFFFVSFQFTLTQFLFLSGWKIPEFCLSTQCNPSSDQQGLLLDCDYLGFLLPSLAIDQPMVFPHWLPDVDPITLGKQFGAILCSRIVSSFSPHKSSKKGNRWITIVVLSKYTYSIPKAGQWKSSSTITFKLLWSLMDMDRLWYSFATPAINAWWISYLDNRTKNPKPTQISSLMKYYIFTNVELHLSISWI